MDNPVILLSTIVFLPAVAALVLAFFPKQAANGIRFVTLGATLVVLLLTLIMAFDSSKFDQAVASMQNTFNISWIPSFDIYYYMGVDGISFPLILLTAFVSVLAMGASWPIAKHVKAYCILFLLLETGMLGVFMALDFFLFYVFWEVMLLPMYFLIGVWGGPRKEYAAIKFFLYTLLGSVFMLIAILMLYFASDLQTLARVDHEKTGGQTLADLKLPPQVTWRLGVGRTDVKDDRASGNREETSRLRETRENFGLVFTGWRQRANEDLNVEFKSVDSGETNISYNAPSNTVTIHLSQTRNTESDVVAAFEANDDIPSVIGVRLAEGSNGQSPVIPERDDLVITGYDSTDAIHTFNLLALAKMGQQTELFDYELLGFSLQHWAFLLLFLGFVIKVPSVPVHTWLPDAHVEAPTPISMILAGVLLKMGGYGIIRICYPICPHGGYDLAFFVCLIGVVSMVYGAMAAMAQKDFKRLVAYSSVSHMGYVVLGLGVWSATAGTMYDPYYWNMGVKGAMFQMIAHGISSAGMFLMVGIVYDRVHHRNLDEFGGLFGKMPVYTGLAIGLFFAGLGLPGLCGFIGEVLVVLSVWKYSQALAIISASVVILTAGYILWAVQRVYLGAEYKGPHESALAPITPRELAISVPLFVMAIALGIFPHHTMLRYMDSTIDKQVEDLAEWTRVVKQPMLDSEDTESIADDDETDTNDTNWTSTDLQDESTVFVAGQEVASGTVPSRISDGKRRTTINGRATTRKVADRGFAHALP